MDDSENNTNDTAAPVAATTEQPATQPAGSQANQGATTFTAEQQELVNRIIAKRLDEDRARRPASAPAARPAQTSKPAELPDVRAEIEEMRRTHNELKQQLDYERRIKALGIDETRAAALFPVYQANPDGFEGVVSAFGIKAPQPAAHAAPQTPPVEAPKPAPAAAPSAPAGSSNLPLRDGAIDLFALSPQQIASLGPSRVREELSKLWSAGNQAAGAPARPKAPSRT